MMVKQLKCAAYTRVSTDSQAEKEYNSFEAQEEKIKAYIRSQENLKLYKVYKELKTRCLKGLKREYGMVD